MAYGLACYNGSDQLTLSSDSFTYGYIGKAAHSVTVSPGTDPVIAYNGYSEYTITWAADIIVALPVLTDALTALISVSQAGSVWTVRVFCSGGSVDSFGFDSQRTTEVFVFGRPTAVSGYGLALYDASGQLTGDLSRRPLAVSEFKEFGSTDVLRPLTGYTKPAIIGGDTTETQESTGPSGGVWIHKRSEGGWRWDSGGTQLGRGTYQTERLQEDIPLANTITRYAVDAIIIEASGLT